MMAKRGLPPQSSGEDVNQLPDDTLDDQGATSTAARRAVEAADLSRAADPHLDARADETIGTAKRQLLVVPPLAARQLLEAEDTAQLADPSTPSRAARRGVAEPDVPESEAADPDVPDSDEAELSNSGRPGTRQLAAVEAASRSDRLASGTRAQPSAAAFAEPRARQQPEPDQELSSTARAQRPKFIVAVGLILALVVSIILNALSAQPSPHPEPLPVLTSVSKVCQGMADGTAGELFAAAPGQPTSGTGQVAIRPIGAHERSNVDDFPQRLSETSLISPINASTVHGGVLTQVGEQTFWANCRTPGTDLYVHAPATDGARLLLVNSDDSTALVDLTITTPDGDVSPETHRGLNLASRGSLSIALADLTTTTEAVGVRVRVTNGRVYAGLQISNSSGGDFSRAAQGGRELLIPTLPAGSTKVHLLVSNPGTTRLTVRLSAYGAAGKYELPGLPEITVDQRRTQRFDLSSAIAGDQISLQLAADQDFAAAVVTQVGSDFAIVTGQADGRFLRATELLSVLPNSGNVMVSNISAEDNSIRVDWGAGQATAERVLAPGTTTQLAIPSGARLVRVTAEHPITGGVIIQAAGGVAVAPLEVGAPTRTVQLVPDPHIG